MKIRLLPLTAVACILAGCNGKAPQGDTPVPRRHAYPRIETADSAFTRIDTGVDRLSIDINSEAAISLRDADTGGTRFIDAAYPRFNSTIYFTVTPVDPATAPEVIGNRLERIRLNLGGSDAELIEFDSPAGLENKVFVSRGDISTPVQFIATDGSRLVVSGVAFVRDASAATADSIAPVTDMLGRDIIHALKTLQR